MIDLDQKIKYFEKEIRDLKTAHVKTSTTIATLEKPATIVLPLKLFGTPGQYWEVISSKKAVLKLTSTDGTDMISALYINGLAPQQLNNRYVFVRRRASGAGSVAYEVYAYSYNNNDYDTLAGGGTINLNYSLTAVGSSNYNLAVSYEEFDPWAV